MEWWMPFVIAGCVIIVSAIVLKISSIYLYASITLSTLFGGMILLAMKKFKVSQCVYDPQPGDMLETIYASIVGANLLVFVILTALRSNPKRKLCACCRRDRVFYSPGFFDEVDTIYSDG